MRFGSVVRRDRLRDGHKRAQFCLRCRGGRLRAGLPRRQAQDCSFARPGTATTPSIRLCTESAPLTPGTVPRSPRSGTRSPACSTGIWWLRTTRHSTCRFCGEAPNTTATSPESFPFACTYRLARSALPEARSWGLKGLAAEFGIPLSHHDPLSDAHAAGLPVAGATRTLQHHASRTPRTAPIPPRSLRSERLPPVLQRAAISARNLTLVQRQGLHSPRRTRPRWSAVRRRTIAFTGALECMPRREAFQAAVDAGAAPTGSVSKRTDYLVIWNNRPAQSRRNGTEQQAPQGPRSHRRRQPDPNHRRRPIHLPPRRNNHPRLSGSVCPRRDPPHHHRPKSSALTTCCHFTGTEGIIVALCCHYEQES